MKVQFLNMLNPLLGGVLSVAEQTPLPMIVYAVFLAVTKIYEYKIKRIKECNDECKK